MPDGNELQRVTNYLRRVAELEQLRLSWETPWEEVRDYILPHRGMFTARGESPIEGRINMDAIVDGTASRAIRIAGAGMQGGLTSPSRPWFRLRMAEDELNQSSAVKAWLAQVEKVMYGAYGRSNFYSSIHDVYTEQLGFGTACIYEEEDWERHIRFRTMTVGEYCLGADGFGNVDTFSRHVFMPARDALKRFPVAMENPNIVHMAENQPFNSIEIVHLIRPRSDRTPGKADGRNKKWESVYIFPGDRKIWDEGGYDEFPLMAPRWSTVGARVYGHSPGMETLPDVKGLQELQRSYLEAVHKMTDPPLRAPMAYRGRLRKQPGGVTYVDAQEDKAIGALIEVQINLQHLAAQIQATQLAVREGFFNDLFLMLLERPNMTATEVAERHEEKLLMLGPVIERQQAELLDPITDRTFKILWRQRMLPPPPPEIQGQTWQVVYVSLLAQAQRLVGIEAIERTAGFVASLAATVPEALDKLDVDEAVDQFAEASGAPEGMIRGDDKVLEIRKARAQAQAQQAKEEQAAQAIEGARRLAQTQTEKPSALTELRSALGV
jgi:hypothetical protein